MIQQEKAWNNVRSSISFLEKTRGEVQKELLKEKELCSEYSEKIAVLKRKIKKNKDEIESIRSSVNTLNSVLEEAYNTRLSQLNVEISEYKSKHIKVYGYSLSECENKGYRCCIEELENLKKARNHWQQKFSDWQERS